MLVPVSDRRTELNPAGVEFAAENEKEVNENE
jgi:hypothetical protein